MHKATVDRGGRRVRALVFKARRRASQRLKDPWRAEYRTDTVIAPPYQFEDLLQIVESSNILPQCIEAMAENVAGFGFRLTCIVPEEEREALKGKIQNERERAEVFLEYACYDKSLTKLRKERQEDLEKTGNAWWEIQRTEQENLIDGFTRLPPESTSAQNRFEAKIYNIVVRGAASS